MMKKLQIATAVTCFTLAMTGCGANTANNLGGAADDQNGDVYGSNMYWDGYGVNNGYPLDGATDRTEYGMAKHDTKSFSEDVKDVGRDLKNGAKDIGRDVKNGADDIGRGVKDAVEDVTDGNSAKMMN